jgi:hypothetical protein
VQLVIADTGPVNYLILIGHINVLPALFHKIILPTAVRAELDDGPSLVKDWIAKSPPWIELRDTSHVHDLGGPLGKIFNSVERKSFVPARTRRSFDACAASQKVHQVIVLPELVPNGDDRISRLARQFQGAPRGLNNGRNLIAGYRHSAIVSQKIDLKVNQHQNVASNGSAAVQNPPMNIVMYKFLLAGHRFSFLLSIALV